MPPGNDKNHFRAALHFMNYQFFNVLLSFSGFLPAVCYILRHISRTVINGI
jgi:hypothetical protein